MSADEFDRLEARVRRLEWDRIGAVRQAADDASLAFWWGLVVGLFFALYVVPYARRIVAARGVDSTPAAEEGEPA